MKGGSDLSFYYIKEIVIIVRNLIGISSYYIGLSRVFLSYYLCTL